MTILHRSRLLALFLGHVPLLAQSPLQWVEATQFTPRQGGVLDTTRGRLVFFGGGTYPHGPLYGDTWEGAGDHWVRRSTTGPAPRAGHCMAYDSGRRRVVLFGGQTSTNPSVEVNDTWEWDGDGWTQRHPVNSPGAYGGRTMTYDAARQRVVLQWGHQSTTCVTWAWDGNNWTILPGTAPPNYAAPMCYDAARQVVVLFGGFVQNGPSLTWELGASGWVQRNPAVSPPHRYGHVFVYDPVRQRSLIYSGSYYSTFYQDAWEWDGVNWTQVASPTTAGGTHAMFFDPVLQRVRLWLGTADRRLESWDWNGTSWTSGSLSDGPMPQHGMACCDDTTRGRVVMHGGARDETWEWDATRWTRRTATTSPGQRQAHAMAHDAARQQNVLFGGWSATSGAFGDTWTWDGNLWIQRAQTGPPARRGHAMAYDAVRQRVVLHGGWSPNSGTWSDTWEWDGATWTQRQVPGPSARHYHAMAADPIRQRLVLFGGFDAAWQPVTDTWEWDGVQWIIVQPAANPGARGWHQMAFDPVQQQVALFGGWRSGPQNDLWHWSGANWVRSAVAAGPSPRHGHAMSRDSVGQRLLVFGGSVPSPYWSTSDETWLLGASAGAQVIGSACAGAGRRPILTCDPPRLGSVVFTLNVHDARPQAPCLFAVSAPAAPLTVGPCTLHVQDPFVGWLTTTDANGLATTPNLPIPLQPALRGAVFHAQAAIVDPAAPLAGVALTAGRRIVLGD